VRPVRGLWLLVWVVVSGCASGGRHTTANPFVKMGKPAMDVGGEAMKPPKAAKAKASTSSRPPALRAASNLLPTVESTDPVLQAALLRLAFALTPEAHRAVADRYRALGILDMSYEHYSRATRIDRTDAAAYEGMARIWRDWGFPALGAADASRAVYYAPSSASAHNTFGTVLAAIGHDAEAREQYERAVQLEPQAAYAWNNLCYLSFLEGDAVAAATQCRTALELDPGMTAARTTLASIDRGGGAGHAP